MALTTPGGRSNSTSQKVVPGVRLSVAADYSHPFFPASVVKPAPNTITNAAFNPKYVQGPVPQRGVAGGSDPSPLKGLTRTKMGENY